MPNSPSNTETLYRGDAVRIRRGAVELALPPLTIRRGDRIGLVGPNGFGKSTLCLVVAGLLPAPPGVVRSREFRNLRLGFLPQRGGVYPNLTAAENIAFFRRMYGHAGSFDARLFPVIWSLGLDNFLDARVRDLSGGYARLAALACVLCLQTDAWILDEPMAGLDDAHRKAAEGAIADAAETALFVIATGHRREDVSFCSTVIEPAQIPR